MLKILRNSVASIFTKILLGFIILSFAIWGMGDIFTGGFFGNTVAEVGEVQINAQQVQNEYQRELNQLRRLNIDAEQARQLGVLDRVVQTMLYRASFDAEARDLGLTASDSNVAEQIRSDPNFRGQLGSFDRLLFEQVLRANGMTEEGFVTELRRNIARNHALDSLAAAIQVPKSVADTIYGWREEKRVAGLTYIPIDETAAVPEPTTSELTEFHKAKAAEFTAPERRAIRFIHLSAAEFAKRITIGDDALAAAFEDRRQDYVTPEKRKVLQMVVSEEAQARAAKDRLNGGDAFDVVAKEVAGQTTDSIDLGEITKDDLPGDLAGDVFALPDGAVSSPIKGPFGWHIFKIESVSPMKEAKLADVREQLLTELKNERAVDDVYGAANKLEDLIGGGMTLGAAAQDLGLSLRTVAAVDARGNDADGKPVPDLPGAPFLETVFTTEIDDFGTLLETQDGGFFILRVSSITPAELQPLADVRDRVAAAWKREKRADLAEARARKVADGLEGGTPLADIPEAAGAALVATKPINRQTGASETSLPIDVVGGLFDLKTVGKTTVGRAGNRFVVAKLQEIQAPQALKDADTYRGLAQNLRSSISSDILHQYNAALRESHGASVNNALLEQLFSEGGQQGYR